MRFDMAEEGGYILAICSADNGAPEDGNLTREEYDRIKTIIAEKPEAPEGFDYSLRADTLTWELTELPPAPTVYTQTSLEAMTNAELEQILAGYGLSASVNKSNMVKLILYMQGGGADA